MEKTAHYDLNQWAGEDRIMRLDFNADNEKLDAALYQLSQTQAAHAAALEAEQQARAAQGTAIRQEFAAGDAAERQTAAAEAAVIRSEMAAGDAAVTGQIALVKLGHIVTQQEAAQIDIHLGEYGLENYAEIRIIPYLKDIVTLYVRVNNISSSLYYSWTGSSQNYLATCYGNRARYYCTLRLTYLVSRFQCSTEKEMLTYIVGDHVPLNSDLTLNFYQADNVSIPAGCEFLIYGVKK